jgi:hypothetical protein
MEPTIVMLHTVLVCMLLIQTTRFVRLSLVLVGLVRRRRISVVVLLVLIKLGVRRSRLVALEMLLLLMALTLARVQLRLFSQRSCREMMMDANYVWKCFLLCLMFLLVNVGNAFLALVYLQYYCHRRVQHQS